MIGELALAGAVFLVPPNPQPVHETITVVGESLEARNVIWKAEELFLRHEYRDAVVMLDVAIEHSRITGKIADMADLNNCRSWLTLKAPHLDARAIKEEPEKAEGYAARAVEIQPESEQYWRDYTAIRLRREIRDNQIEMMRRGSSEYKWAKQYPWRDGSPETLVMLSPSSIAHFRTLAGDALSSSDIAIPAKFSVASDDSVSTGRTDRFELVDGLIRERAAAWNDWIALWNASIQEDPGGGLFADLTQQPSGSLRAIAASTLAMLYRGNFQGACKRLTEAIVISSGTNESTDLILIRTLAELGEQNTKAASDDYYLLQHEATFTAFVLHTARIHNVIDSNTTNCVIVARVLFIAQGLDVLAASQALHGVGIHTSRGEYQTIDQEQKNQLQRQLRDLNKALNDLSEDTKIEFEKLELDDQRRDTEIAAMEAGDSQLKDEYLELLFKFEGLNSSINAQQRQIKGLAYSFVTLRDTVEHDFAKVYQRLAKDEVTFTAFRDELTAALAGFQARLTDIGTHDLQFRQRAARHIADLSQEIADITRWRSKEDAPMVRDFVIDLLKTVSSLLPKGESAAANVVLTIVKYFSRYLSPVEMP